MDNIVVMKKDEAREFANKIKKNPDGKKYAIISILDVGEKTNRFVRSDSLLGVFHMHFSDADWRDANALQASDVKKMMNFVHKFWTADVIIVECKDGDHRSAGIAAGLLEVCKRNGKSILRDSRYHPNMYCYWKIWERVEPKWLTNPEFLKDHPHPCLVCKAAYERQGATVGSSVACNGCCRTMRRLGLCK